MMISMRRECMRKECIRIYIGQLAILAVLSAGWWGILYPNLSMTEETFQAVAEDGQTDDTVSGTEGFFAMLKAQPEEIKVKSRLLDAAFEWSGFGREKETEKMLQNGEEDGKEQQCTDRGV